jgi:phage replication O-like protein O
LTIRRATGWTPVPHDILEELARAPLPRIHHAVVAAIVRETLGYHRDHAVIRVGDLAKATEIHPRSVRRALVDLEAWRVIFRRGGGQGRAASFGLRPPERWRIGASVDTLARRAARLRAGLAVQLELGLAGVGILSVLPLRRVTSRDTHRATAREVTLAAPPYKEKERVVKTPPQKAPAPRSDPAAWSDVTGTHRALSRRLETLGFSVPADLFHRVGKALAHARSRGSMRGDPLDWAEFWVLDDLQKLGRQPTTIRRSKDETMPQTTPDPGQADFVTEAQKAAQRRTAAARMRLRWRTRSHPTEDEIAAEAATLSEDQIDETFVELTSRMEKRNAVDGQRRSAAGAQSDSDQKGRRRR